MDPRKELEELRRLEELEMKAAGMGGQAPSLPTTFRGGAQRLAEAVGDLSEGIGRYNPLGAPLRKGISTYQEGGDVGQALEAYGAQFGEPTGAAPRMSQILEKAGVPAEANIRTPLITKPFDPEGGMLPVSPAGIGGAVLETALDPTFALGGGIPKAGAKGVEVAGAAARGLGRFAEERAAKAALGSNVRAFREAAGMSARGVPDAERAQQKVRALGRTMLETKGFGPLSKTEDIGQLASKQYEAVGAAIGKIGEKVDQAIPTGAVDTGSMGGMIRQYADSLADVPQYDTVKARLAEVADRFEATPAITFAEAQKIKSAFKFKPQESDALVGNQDVTNFINRMMSEQMENAADKAAIVMKGAPDFAKIGEEYRQAKQKYGVYKKVAETGTERGVRDISNRMMSPSDYGVGLSSGLGAAQISGDPIVSVLTVGGAALLNKLARDRGPAFAAKTADTASKALQKIVQASKNPVIQRSSGILGEAAKRGSQAVILYHNMLMNNDAEYRKAMSEELAK